MLFDYLHTKLSGIGYLPPIQIMFMNEVDKNEFKLLGVSSTVKCIKITAYEPKCFIRNKLIYIYNASECAISYNWYNKHNVSTIENSSTGFHCYQVSGNLVNNSVLKLEMIFNPQDYGVYESLWLLEIPDYNFEQAFLFIGETKVPDIIFEPNILVLDPVLTDIKSEKKLTIHNKEKVPFKYKVDAFSLCSDIECEKLDIIPDSAVLEPDTTNEIMISSTLHVARKYVYKTFWSFENVARKWCYKVITECINIEVNVCCTIDRNSTKENISLKDYESNIINLGKVLVNEILNFIFIVSNKGKVAICYEWIFSENATNNLSIEVNPYEKFVPDCSKFSICIKVTVLKKFQFRDVSFILKIFKGPVYTVFLNGTSEDPLYRISFKEFDFGAHLIQTNNEVLNVVNLQFENLDEEMLLIEVKFPVIDHFKIQLACSNVSPKSLIDIPIYFFPRKMVKYNETMHLLINDTVSETISLLGEGTIFQIDVVKPSKRIINFDKIGVNELVTEETEIMNISNIVFNIVLKIINEYADLIEITLDPTDTELKPNSMIKIFVSVKCSSFGDFSGIEVWATCREYEIILYSLTIQCVGANLAFDKETINFFPHFRKEFQKETVAIINTGNIPTRFELDTTDLPKIFKILPLHGECLPGIPYILNILCCLKFITDYLSAKVKCINKRNNEYFELTLVIYPFSPCIKLKVLKFLCPVRQQNTDSISVENVTKKPMSLMPLITGQYFSGDATLEVPPRSKTTYSVIYKPLTMTKEKKTHKGILVIPTQPEEVIVQLEGRSTDPLLEGKLLWRARAREVCVITLNVVNPLESLQKMSILFKKYYSNRNIFNIDGNNCIVLKSKDKKEYMFNFFAYKEGTVNFDIIFKNDETFEYMFYNVTVVIEPPEVTWETIEMNTILPNSISKTINIYNPLKVKDKFRLTSIVPNYIVVKPSVFEIPPMQHEKLSITYKPKKVEEREDQLVLTGNLLGNYFYRIILHSKEPFISNTIWVSCTLGSSFPFTLLLPKPVIKEVPSTLPSKNIEKSFIRSKVKSLCHSVRVTVISKKLRKEVPRRQKKLVKEILLFNSKSDNPVVTMVKPVDNSNLKELDLRYEPVSIGTSRTIVKVEYFKPYKLYLYNIVGQCEPSQPLGPFDISVSKPFFIQFKNVFTSEQRYSCSCLYDEGFLEVSRPIFTLNAKKAISIKISVNDEAMFKRHSTMLRITDIPEKLYYWDYYFNVHR